MYYRIAYRPERSTNDYKFSMEQQCVLKEIKY